VTALVFRPSSLLAFYRATAWRTGCLSWWRMVAIGAHGEPAEIHVSLRYPAMPAPGTVSGSGRLQTGRPPHFG